MFEMKKKKSNRNALVHDNYVIYDAKIGLNLFYMGCTFF